MQRFCILFCFWWAHHVIRQIPAGWVFDNTLRVMQLLLAGWNTSRERKHTWDWIMHVADRLSGDSAAARTRMINHPRVILGTIIPDEISSDRNGAVRIHECALPPAAWRPRLYNPTFNSQWRRSRAQNLFFFFKWATILTELFTW